MVKIGCGKMCLDKKLDHIIFGFTILLAVVISTYFISTFKDIPVNKSAGYFIPISKAVLNG